MNVEDKLKEFNKLGKKKKWEDASKAAIELAEYYIDKNNFAEGLQFFEQAVSAQQKEKKADKIIVLYRKIIGAARKGKNKTRKELFRYAAAAIPLIEEYFRVLKESNRYLSKHGAMTRYFLGECLEIVSGVTQRDDEFIRAGQIFVQVGKKLSGSKKTEGGSDEAFEKARTIFDLINNREESFEALLVEAEINVRKYRLERGFALFDEGRGMFGDETHQTKVVDLEKNVYAEMGLSLLQNHYSNEEQHKIAEMLISKSREAHLLAKSLDKVPEILFEIGKIDIQNKQLEKGFSSFDEAIEVAIFATSKAVDDKKIPTMIIEYLYQEGKKLADDLLKAPSRIDSTADVDNLLLMTYFDKMEEICKKLDRGQEAEEVALYIWQLGLNLLNQKDISDDFPFIEKAFTFLTNNNRFNGLHTIGDVLEKRLEKLAEKKKINKFQRLKTFLVDSYTRIDDNQSAGFLNVKIAQTYASWGNYESQVACLREAATHIQNTDAETVRAFSEALYEQFSQMQSYIPDSIYNEVLYLVGNTYLQLKDNDKYDSLFAGFALKSLEDNDFSKAMEYHQQDYEFLVRTKNITRALARVEKFLTALFSKREYKLANILRSKQIQLLVESKSSQKQVLQTIESLEDQIAEVLSQKADISVINDVFNNIIKLYEYLGLKEVQGDAAFEMTNRLFENDYFDAGFEYLNRAFEKFKSENEIEKYGPLLDFAFEKKNMYLDLADLEIADRFLDFLITTLKELDQIKEAAGLIMNRAVQLVPLDDTKAFDQFEEAKELISKTESTDDILQFYHDFGSALLKARKIDEGMEILAKAESSTSTNSLVIADTCLTVAKDRFTEKDYDTYFVLIDRALTIYTELEMFQESSSIALTEARKLWSVNNLPYTMIFLERAWAPLSVTYDEELNQSIQPLLQVAEEFISSLFDQKRYDEAKNFLEFQERIYKQLNLTEKILEVEKRKIDALIGRGNIEGALSQVYDIATIGIEESKFIETISLLKTLLPTFVIGAPKKAKFLLKIFINLLITMEPEDLAQKLVRETIDHYILLIGKTLSQNNKTLFQDQTSLFINSLAEIAEAEDILTFFIINLGRKVAKMDEIAQFISVLKFNLPNLIPSKPEVKMKIINEIISIIDSPDIDQQNIIDGFDLLSIMTVNFDDENRERISVIFLKKMKKFRSQREIYDHITQLILQQSEKMVNVSATLILLYGLTEEDLETENYLNALRRLDDVISKLEQAPTEVVTKFVELLNKYLIKSAKKKDKKWMDLLTTKHKIILERFLNEGDKFTAPDQQFSESILDDMLELTKKSSKIQRKNK